MNLLRQTLRSALSATLPTDRWLARGRRTWNGCRPAVSLTFDDGPHPDITPKVLDRLRDSAWKGTFFVVGEKAAQYPELVRRIVAEGHELGTHSWTHSEPSATSAAQLIQETIDCRQLLKDLTGHDVHLMRPPKGSLTWSKLRGLWAERQVIALWNIDPKDYRMGCEPELERWTQGYEPAHGDVVLMHDAYPQVLQILETWQQQQRLDQVLTVTCSDWISERSLIAQNREVVTCR